MQRGAGTLLLMALFVPILFYGTTILLSLYKVDSQRGTLQQGLEQALLNGARYLPNANEAMRIAKSELVRKFGDRVSITEKSKRPYTIALSVNQTTERKIVLPLFNQGRVINVKESAQARVTAQPKDIYIFFENSSYLAPPIEDIGTDRAFYWGQSNKRNRTDGNFTRRRNFGYFETFLALKESTLLSYKNQNKDRVLGGNTGLRQLMAKYSPHWQSAQLFLDSSLYPGRLRSKLRRDNAITQAVLTQACFNPVYSAIKKAAIHLLDHFSVSPLNRISVASGPISGAPPGFGRLGKDSNAGNIFQVQPLIQGGDPLATGRANLENNKGERVSFDRNVEDNFRLRVRDQECWSAMKIASDQWNVNQSSFYGTGETGSTIYALPMFPDYVPNIGSKKIGDNIPNPMLRLRRYERNKEHYELVTSSISRLRTREAIYSRSVAEDYDGEVRRLDDTIRFNKIIDHVIQTFVDAEPPNYLQRLRGIAGASTEKRAYIILGDTPHLRITNSTGNLVLHNLRTAGKALEDAYFDRLLAELSRLKRAMSDRQEKLRLLIIIPRHEGSYSQEFCSENWTKPYELVCKPFRDDVSLLRDRINQHTAGWKKVEVTTIPATDVGTLATDLLSSLISSGHHYVLSDA